MADTFVTAGTIITGWGASAEAGAVAARLGKRALVVTGRTALRGAGRASKSDVSRLEPSVTDRLVGSLTSQAVQAFVFHQVEPEPAVGTVDLARAAFRQADCDLVVACGGGSVLDVGKAAAALARQQAPTASFFSLPVAQTGAPCIALPTTAGTGAEVTPNSVLTDPDMGVKQSIRGPALLPTAAIVDPELTVSCPPALTAAAGMDALTQAIESFWSRHSTSITEALAAHALELAWMNIERAFGNGQDRLAREHMASAALLAGMAMANARLGAVHGLAHPLGLRCHLAHGVVCAAVLPHVLRLNREASADKYEILCAVFDGDAAEAVEALLDRLKLPRRLGPLGLTEADFDAIIAQSLSSGSLKANPRTVSAEDARAILSKLM